MHTAYATPAWSSFVSKEQEGYIDAFLRRSYRCGFSQHLQANCCQDWPHPTYKYYQSYLLSTSSIPDIYSAYAPPWQRTFTYRLPTCMLQLYKNSFINQCLFDYIVSRFCFFLVMCITRLSFHFTILCMRLSCIMKRYLIFDNFSVLFGFRVISPYGRDGRARCVMWRTGWLHNNAKQYTTKIQPSKLRYY